MQRPSEKASLDRLTPEQLSLVMAEWHRSESYFREALVRHFASPTMQDFVKSCSDIMNRAEGDGKVFRYVLAVSFQIGWLAREALMESEELERMASIDEGHE